MFAEIPGARIWYEDTGGSGEPVILLHSRTGSAALWAHQLPAFAKAGYRCIAYDRRGQGRSEADAKAKASTFASEELKAFAQSLGIESFHVVGTAAGGIVACDFVVAYPECVRSVVIANSITGVTDEEFVALRDRIRPPASMAPELRELGPSYRALHPDGVRRWLELEHAAGKDEAKRTPATRAPITIARLAALRLPTLLITGDADLYLPPALLRVLAAGIPHARAIVIPECGHSAYWEQPALFNKSVLDFLARASGGAAS